MNTGSIAGSLRTQLPWLISGSSIYPWAVLATTMIATFMAVLDATIVNVALPKLMSAFTTPVYIVEWILTGYLLIFGIMLPTSGWLADSFGHKPMYILGVFLFTLGSFLSSISWSIGVLIVFRIVQGAGAGLLLPIGMAIVTREFPPEKRGTALGFWSISASASVSLGPTLGGFLIDRFSWHTIFDINVPVGIVAMAAAILVLRDYRSTEDRTFDIPGFISMSAFLTGLLLALQNGNASWNTGGWTSTYILTCFTVAFTGLAVFLIAEFTVAHPLIELRLFKFWNFSFTNVVLLLFGFGVFGSTFLVPLYLQNVLGYTPFQAGLVFFPMGIVTGITAPIGGILTDRIGGKIPAIIGLVLMSLSFYQYSSLTVFSEYHQIMVPLYFRAVGMGFIFSSLTTVALSEIASRDIARASGLINVLRQLGGSFGVAIFGTILTQRTLFHSIVNGELISRHPDLLSHISDLLSMQAGNAGIVPLLRQTSSQSLLAQIASNDAFVKSIDDVFLVSSIMIVISIVPALLLRSRIKKIREDPEPDMS